MTRRFTAAPTPNGISSRIRERSRVSWAGDAYGEISTDGTSFWAMVDALDPDECLPEGLVVVLDDGSWLQTGVEQGEYGWLSFSTPDRGPARMRTLLGDADMYSVDQRADPLPGPETGPVARMKAEIAGIKARHADDADARFDALVDLRVRRAEARGAGDITEAEWDWTIRLLAPEVAHADPGPRPIEDDPRAAQVISAQCEVRQSVRKPEYIEWLVERREGLVAEFQARELPHDLFDAWLPVWDAELRRMGQDPGPLPERPSFRPRLITAAARDE